MDAETLAKQINDHARAMNADGLLLGRNLLAVAQHIDELIPEGSVLVDRARFERLREYVAAHIAFEAATVKHEMTREIAERLVVALESFTLSDLDPSP